MCHCLPQGSQCRRVARAHCFCEAVAHGLRSYWVGEKRGLAAVEELPANPARRRANPQESRKTALDAFRQIPYSRRPRVKWKAVQGGTAGSSRWAAAPKGPHLGRAQARVCDPRSAMPQARRPRGALRENLRADSAPCATEPEGEVANVQSLPEKSSVLRPPGTQPFRGLFLRADPQMGFQRGQSQFSLRDKCDSPRAVSTTSRLLAQDVVSALSLQLQHLVFEVRRTGFRPNSARTRPEAGVRRLFGQIRGRGPPRAGPDGTL